ncbi:MAG: TetR family transcriptional regulator [Rubrivivax sp.]|nr:TetR family transcriptional regulator [Rubrivivax sp.]
MSQTRPVAVKRGRPARGGAVAGEMREALLDHAEALLSQHGFHGVTVRQVASAAHVDPALVHYYFDTKSKLFDAVFLRRAEIVNAERIAAMETYRQAAGSDIQIEGCIEAFLEPIVRHSVQGDVGWKNYFRLVALVNSSSGWGGETMARYFDPVIRKLVQLLRLCMPQASDENLFWCYHFLSGALTLSLSETGRIDRLSEGLCTSTDHLAIYHRLVPFAAAGFRRVCLHGGAPDNAP